MQRLAPILAGSALLLACGAKGELRAVDAEGQALSRVALDVLEREACPRLLVRTFSLDDPKTHETTGKLWVRRCSARAGPRGLDVDVDVLGWQWAGESSWGFAIGEYVYFTAAIRARLEAEVDTTAGTASLRVFSPETPSVAVRAIGRVSAHAETPASSILGLATGLVGNGPNDLATAALRGRVSDLVKDRAKSGFAVVLGDTPVPGAPAAAVGKLLEETQGLHPGGALLSGSYPPGLETELRYTVRSGEVLARAVCVDTATAIVDATMAGTRGATREAPTDVLTLRGAGVARISPRACPWVLVTGPRSDTSANVSITLAAAPPVARHSGRRWVKPTLLSYELTKVTREQKLFSVALGTASDLRVLGRPLVAAHSHALRLAGHPTELRDGSALMVRMMSLRPLPPSSWWSGQARYEETELGRGTLVPAIDNGHEERDVIIESKGSAIGRARLALDVLEVE